MQTNRLFSSKSRPMHYGNYPLHRLKRTTTLDEACGVLPHLRFHRPLQPDNIVNAMADHQAMLDAIRDGLVNKAKAEIPDDEQERANHVKSFGYFCDAALVGIGAIDETVFLDQPTHNLDVNSLVDMLRSRQTKTLAAGIDMIMADLKESVEAPPRTVAHHHRAITFIYDYRRDPYPDEPGADWLDDAQAHRACLLSSETAIVIANYIRLLGFDAKAHTMAASDVDLAKVAVRSGVVVNEKGDMVAPWFGKRFGLSVVTTDMPLAADQPLAPLADQPQTELTGLNWKLGRHSAKNAYNQDPFKNRDYKDSALALEKLTYVDQPTTYLDEANIPRVPKRTDMFARAQFGDMGKANQKNATNGYYARKAPTSFAQRRALGAFVLLQDGDVTPQDMTAHNISDNQAISAHHSDLIKATSYFLGVDAVGLSRCPDWVWYSHDARGDAIIPPHDNAISMVIDQGFETMEGASGDDWISVAQSMRAYLRFSLLGGVIANQIRRLGYEAKAHSVMDGEVLQPPLLLLSGLGEVSRIGEVIMHPYLGPRLKSGVVTTTMPMAHDKPIDFGMQNFCESCQKCARECPSGAITAGPKLMFNGYETWKSDSQKCTTYRIGTEGGAMCGRCMKTCPWNLEGLFVEAPFRWAAMHVPKAAPLLAKLDDMVGHGKMNPMKKWWWDIALQEDGGYRPTSHPINQRGISPELTIHYDEQTLAVYPAPLTPHPYPYPDMMDREAGIAAYQEMISAKDYQSRLAQGDDSHLHKRPDQEQEQAASPVLPVIVTKVEELNNRITKYELRHKEGLDLPAWQAGAHIDVLVSPEFLRPYSMSGNPDDRSVYQIAVLREDQGRGGSLLMHRIFTEGRQIFISHPINHFAMTDTKEMVYLMGGGIGITPMIAFAHERFAKNLPFHLHYSVSCKADLAFVSDLSNFPWSDQVHYHISDEGSRLDLPALFQQADPSSHIYSCGPEAYMSAVRSAAQAAGLPEDHIHQEFFSVPELPDYENHPFTIHIESTGQILDVPADKTAADVLNDHGFGVDVKCSDGLCGVCQCGYNDGEIEHRDFVLSKAQRETQLILCQSRAAQKDGQITLKL